MSKYIRTKGNIIIEFDYTKEVIIDGIKHIVFTKINKDNDDRYYIAENYIVKQADTIEKLCDEFVGIIKGERFVFSNTKENELFVKEQNKYHAYKVLYGAIWTDKGLIYVAKMNEKGDLELLWQKSKCNI